MPEYYKTQKGYCYKKTQKGGSKRISKENYEKAIIKQKGGVSSVPRTNNVNKRSKKFLSTKRLPRVKPISVRLVGDRTCNSKLPPELLEMIYKKIKQDEPMQSIKFLGIIGYDDNENAQRINNNNSNNSNNNNNNNNSSNYWKPKFSSANKLYKMTLGKNNIVKTTEIDNDNFKLERKVSKKLYIYIINDNKNNYRFAIGKIDIDKENVNNANFDKSKNIVNNLVYLDELHLFNNRDRKIEPTEEIFTNGLREYDDLSEMIIGDHNENFYFINFDNDCSDEEELFPSYLNPSVMSQPSTEPQKNQQDSSGDKYQEYYNGLMNSLGGSKVVKKTKKTSNKSGEKSKVIKEKQKEKSGGNKLSKSSKNKKVKNNKSGGTTKRKRNNNNKNSNEYVTSRSSTGQVTYNRNNNTNNNNGYNANINNNNANEIPPSYFDYQNIMFPEDIKKVKDTRVALRGVVPSEIGNIIGYKKVKEEKKKRAQNEKKHRNNVIKKKENEEREYKRRIADFRRRLSIPPTREQIESKRRKNERKEKKARKKLDMGITTVNFNSSNQNSNTTMNNNTKNMNNSNATVQNSNATMNNSNATKQNSNATIQNS
jgi:hypothetical protein